METAAPGLEDPNLRTLRLQQDQQAQCLRIGDVEIVAGENADPCRRSRLRSLAGERVIKVGQQQAQAARLHERHRKLDLVRSGDRVAELR